MPSGDERKIARLTATNWVDTASLPFQLRRGRRRAKAKDNLSPAVDRRRKETRTASNTKALASVLAGISVRIVMAVRTVRQMGRNDLDLRRKANEKAKARAAHATLPSLLAVRIARSMPSADIGKQGIANWARTAAFDTRRPNQQKPLLPKRLPVKP